MIVLWRVLLSYLENNTAGVFETTAVNIERVDHVDREQDSRLVNLEVGFSIRWYTFYDGKEHVGTF